MPARSNMYLGAARAWAPAGAGQLERPVSRRIWYLVHDYDHARTAGRTQEGEHVSYDIWLRRAVPCSLNAHRRPRPCTRSSLALLFAPGEENWFGR